jgi:hypothetical protein
MAEEKIRIIIDGDSRGVVNASQQAESSISKLGKIIGGLAIGGGVLMLAKKGFDVLSDAIRGTIGFIKSSIDAAADEQLQLKKLEQALISTSHFTKAGYKELVDYASSLQKVTRYADENIVAVEAQLAMFKLSNEEIKLATQATLDLAAAKDMDLQSASVLIGKVMAGEMGMLKRYGIILDDNTIKTGDWKTAIQEISIAFGGQATAQAETYLGSMDRLKNMFGDMKEELGNAFIPTISKVVEWFTKGSDITDGWGNKIGEMASPFEKLSGWVHEATEAFGKYLELNWDNIIGLAEDVFKRIENFIRIVKEADYSEITTGINDLKEAFGILIGDETTGITGADAKYQSFIDNIGEGMQTLATFIAGIKAFGDTVYFIIGSITNTIAILIEMLSALGLWFISAGTDGQEEFKHLDLMIKAFRTGFIEDSKKMQESWSRFSEFMNRSTGEAKKAVDGYSESLNKVPREITTTITTKFRQIGGYAGYAYTPTGMKQSGGISSGDIYAKDLRIPIFKGEAVLPAELTRAIKENRGSFAGVNAPSSNSITNQFNVYATIREEADIRRIATELYDMQQIRGRLA